jgi:hypothetical protein
MRHVLLLLCIGLASLATPTQAQVNDDIIIIEGPEGGGDDGGGTHGVCEECCSKDLITEDCHRICGCGGGGVCDVAYAYSWMRSANVQWPVIGGVVQWPVIGGVVASIETTRERLSSTPRGRMLLSSWVTHARQVQTIFAQDPALATRIGVALFRYWPHDMWTDSGAQAHSVSREAMVEFRTILTKIAEADEATGGSGLAATIRSEVLPELSPELIGKPHRQAFLCFIGGQSCR